MEPSRWPSQIRVPQAVEVPGSSINLRKLVTRGGDLVGNGERVDLSNLNGNYVRARSYSIFSGRADSRRKSSRLFAEGFEREGKA